MHNIHRRPTPEYVAMLIVPYGASFYYFRRRCNELGYSTAQSGERIRAAYRNVCEQLHL